MCLVLHGGNRFLEVASIRGNCWHRLCTSLCLSQNLLKCFVSRNDISDCALLILEILYIIGFLGGRSTQDSSSILFKNGHFIKTEILISLLSNFVLGRLLRFWLRLLLLLLGLHPWHICLILSNKKTTSFLLIIISLQLHFLNLIFFLIRFLLWIKFEG